MLSIMSIKSILSILSCVAGAQPALSRRSAADLQG